MADMATLWVGERLSGYEALCIDSFLAHGHRFRLYSFRNDLTVPDGCERCPAEEIADPAEIFGYGGDRVQIAAFANLFRYRLVHATGVCWVDADVLCLSPDWPTTPFLFARQDDDLVNNAVLRFPAGHEALKLAAEFCWERRDVARWGDLGPRLLTEIIAEYDLASHILPAKSFYPIHWTRALETLVPGGIDRVTAVTSGATALHLWNEIFRRSGVDKRRLPPARSYLGRLVRERGLHDWFSA